MPQNVVLLTTNFQGRKHFSTLSLNMQFNIFRAANYAFSGKAEGLCDNHSVKFLVKISPQESRMKIRNIFNRIS